MRERIEGHWLGRALLSWGILAVLATMVIPNLPRDSRIGATRDRILPLTEITGLHQSWGVFSSIEHNVTAERFAEVRFADGSRATWRPPSEGGVFGAYANYRWRAAASHIWRSERLRDDFATWLARRMDDSGRRPLEVIFKRRYAKTPPIGSGRPRHWTVVEVDRVRLAGHTG